MLNVPEATNAKINLNVFFIILGKKETILLNNWTFRMDIVILNVCYEPTIIDLQSNVWGWGRKGWLDII